MELTKELLINCLLHRHDYESHGDPDETISREDCEDELKTMSLEQLIAETECDEVVFPMKDFIELWNKEI